MKTYYYKMITVSLLISVFASCERTPETVCPSKNETATPKLTVEFARQVFDAEETNQTRSAIENLSPFAIGNPVLYWEKAEISSSDLISCVDVPISGQQHYKVIRYDEDGKAYAVNAHAKIIIVQSNETLKIQSFIRVCIPDAGCDSPYSENICNQTLNCESRGNYTGLEYYATLEGLPAAISRYEEGEMVCGLYFFDETLTREEKVYVFAQLLGNTRIVPMEQTRTLAEDDWDYMHEHQHGEYFIGSDGDAYVYVDANNDGVVDSYVTFIDYLYLYYNGASGGGHSGGSSNGGHTGSGSEGSSGDSSGNGNGSGSGSGGNSGSSGGVGSGSNTIIGDGTFNGVIYDGGNITNPLPTNPDLPYIGGGELVDPGELPGGGIGGGSTTPEEDNEEEDEETRLGREGIQKMISDLENGNVQMYECTIGSTGEALLTAAGVGSNTTGIITSCINFLESADSYAKAFGNNLSVAGFVISTAQTCVAFSDGEYSTADWMNAVSTALSGISIVLLPTPFTIVGGALGVTSCLIGLASNFVSYNAPMLIHLEMPDGGDAFLYLA